MNISHTEDIFRNAPYKGLQHWLDNLEKVKKYIDDNSQAPSMDSGDSDVRNLAHWFMNECYGGHPLWVTFSQDGRYRSFIPGLEELWSFRLTEVEKYIDENSRLPFPSDENLYVKKLGRWVLEQKNNLVRAPSDECIMNWVYFINDKRYAKYFETSPKMLMNIAKIHNQCVGNEELLPDVVESVGEWLRQQGAK
jgi:hypothetical protein